MVCYLQQRELLDWAFIAGTVSYRLGTHGSSAVFVTRRAKTLGRCPCPCGKRLVVEPNYPYSGAIIRRAGWDARFQQQR